MKTAQLPLINYPYVAEFEFYQHIENVNGKLKKTGFEGGQVISPFYFLLKVKEIENSGKMTVLFYDSEGSNAARRAFAFGEQGQYYEYILFFDRIDGLAPGKYRCAIFLNDSLIYEDYCNIGQ